MARFAISTRCGLVAGPKRRVPFAAPTRRALLLGLVALAAPPALAEAPARAPVPAPRSADLPPESRALLAASRVTGVTGWQVRDLDTGAVLDEWRAATPFVPASVAKLPTAAFALDRLGPEHRFETRVLATAPVIGRATSGDLVLAGGGDPELDTDALDGLASLTAARLDRVQGDLLADPGAYGGIAAIAPGQPPEASYNPGVAALALNFNRVRVEWPGRGAPPATYAQAARSRPTTDAVRVETAARAVRVIEALPADRETGAERWRLDTRALKRPGGRWLPVRAPAAYAARVFADLARGAGADLGAPRVAPGAADAGGHVVARHESAPLASILRRMLFHSTNVTAEMVGLGASAEEPLDALVARTAPGSTVAVLATGAAAAPVEARAALPASARAMTRWAAARAGFAPDDPGFHLANHSGLSIASRLSPERAVDLLIAEARLGRPVPGRVNPRRPLGVAQLLREKRVAVEGDGIDHARLGVAAKTGTMDFVRGLAGYVHTPGGRRLAFAVFSNDLDRREGARRGSRTWLARARSLEAGLVRAWVRMADAEAAAR
ncbi:MAG: D-alanyl-D-alanine carboxypeptidase/D-alanyl-D-alanine-endopeptidase [Paracoccaceae bacterium]